MNQYDPRNAVRICLSAVDIPDTDQFRFDLITLEEALNTGAEPGSKIQECVQYTFEPYTVDRQIIYYYHATQREGVSLHTQTEVGRLHRQTSLKCTMSSTLRFEIVIVKGAQLSILT